MEKLHLSQILVKNAQLTAVKLTNAKASGLINDTKKQQEDILKLRVVDQEMLKMVVQL